MTESTAKLGRRTPAVPLRTIHKSTA